MIKSFWSSKKQLTQAMAHACGRVQGKSTKRDADASVDLVRHIVPWSISLSSFDDCRSALESHAPRLQARRSIERQLQEQLNSFEQGFLPGYCWVCHSLKAFAYDWLYSDGRNVNWRERVVCPTCQLNNRLRLSVQTFERLVRDSHAAIYITEQVTPLASHLTKHFPATVTSEYLGPQFSSGQVSSKGIRHEDVTALSFAECSFDYVLSFDVLEHVPDYRAALAEFFRVLRPGGCALLSVPFGLLYERNLVRARIETQGNIEHLLPAEYHGDPIDPNKGVLCYYHFGWELLQDLRKAGFSNVSLSMTWSLEFGHVGDEQLLISAQR